MSSHRKVWSEEEVNMLKQTFHLYTDKELGELYGVSDGSIKAKRRELGLLRQPKRDVPEGYRYCKNCDKVLPIEYFYTAKDKVDCYCKECKKHMTAYYYTKKYIEMKEKGYTDEDLIQAYIEKYRTKKLFCSKCNKEKTIDDYSVYMQRTGRVTKECLECKKSRRKNKN